MILKLHASWWTDFSKTKTCRKRMEKIIQQAKTTRQEGDYTVYDLGNTAGIKVGKIRTR